MDRMDEGVGGWGGYFGECVTVLAGVHDLTDSRFDHSLFGSMDGLLGLWEGGIPIWH